MMKGIKGKLNSQVCLLTSVGSRHLTAHKGEGSPGSRWFCPMWWGEGAGAAIKGLRKMHWWVRTANRKT